jgi:hypothetical protein
MQSLAGISMLITMIVTVTVGVRLLLVARRTRMLPELLFAITFISSGLGQAFGQLGMRVIWNDPGDLATFLNTLCFGAVVIGNLALWQATWRIYHSGDSIGRWICGLGSAVVIVGYGVRIFDGDFVTATPGSRGFLIHIVARAVLLTWTSYESIRYWRLLQKRLALGLADPIATNQILLWGYSAMATLATTLLIGGSIFALGRHPLEIPSVVLMLTGAVLVISSCMWCAFFPPAWLRERIEAREIVPS